MICPSCKKEMNRFVPHGRLHLNLVVEHDDNLGSAAITCPNCAAELEAKFELVEIQEVY